MFTGLVEMTGTIARVTRSAAGVELTVEAPVSDPVEGESISVNGACLTVLRHGDGWFTVGAMEETIGRTTIGTWNEGRRVNLERAMSAGSRFGGHIVQGHVDGVGAVDAIERREDAVLVDVVLPAGLSDAVILHGSVALDGVSLTVNRLDGDKLQVALIGYTLRHTALGDLGRGDGVNVETDVVGKYVRRLAAPYLNR